MTSDLFYTFKPFIPRAVQIALRRQMAQRKLRSNRGRWPIWEAGGAAPPGWPGWPEGRRFALVLTHDVEFRAGMSHCEELADLEQDRGFRSVFAFVPLRYELPERLRKTLVARGFDVLVHDLYHDGKLFRNRAVFEVRRDRIRGYLREWQVRGFASGAMHHDLRWIADLGVECDISTYDVDPFEPQPCGCGLIFPYCVQSPDGKSPGFLELPYTLPQDFTLFVLLGQRTDAIWRQKLDWIAERGGMALVKSHPDYMAFAAGGERMDRYPVYLYTDFLDYVKSRYSGEVWLASPYDVARFWSRLRPAGIGAENALAAAPTLCARCREAHAEGWLSHYPRAEACR